MSDELNELLSEISLVISQLATIETDYTKQAYLSEISNAISAYLYRKGA